VTLIIEMNTNYVVKQNDLLTGIRLKHAPPRLQKEEEIETERLKDKLRSTKPTEVIAFILVKSDLGIPRQPPPPKPTEEEEEEDDDDDDDDDGRPRSQQKTRRIEPSPHFPFVVEYCDRNTNKMLGDGSPKLRLKVPSLTNNLWYIKTHVNEYMDFNVQVIELRSFSNQHLCSGMSFEFYDLHPDNTEIWLLPVGSGPPSKEDTYALAHRVLEGLLPLPNLPQIDTVATRAALASAVSIALSKAAIAIAVIAKEAEEEAVIAKEAEEEALSAASSEQLSFGRRYNNPSISSSSGKSSL